MNGVVCVTLLLLTFSSLVTCQAPGDYSGDCTPDSVSSRTRVQLDSYNYMTLLPSPWSQISVDGDNNTWEEIDSSESCRRSITTCSAGDSSQRNLLITQHIDVSMAQEVNVIVDFTDGNCTTPQSPEQCTTDFALFTYKTSVMDPSRSMNISNYQRTAAIVMNNTPIPIPVPDSGLFLAFEDTSACVVINRVRVLYSICEETQNELALYLEATSSETVHVMGVCVADATLVAGASLTALCRYEESFDFSSAGGCECNAGFQENGDRCEECPELTFKLESGNSECAPCPTSSANTGTGNTECSCDQGYQRGDPNNVVSGCTECIPGFFMDGSTCTMCGSFSSSTGGTVTDCSCDDGRVTVGGMSTTTTAACDSCSAGYYSSSEECVECLAMSNREFNQPQEKCVCEDNRATSANFPNTTVLPCIGCASGFFQDGSMCVKCPNNSISENFDDRSCTCKSGTTLNDGSSTTTSVPCSGCAPGYYRSSGICVNCPDNSVRDSATSEDSICGCSVDFARINITAPEQNCLPIVGFRASDATLTEGAPIQSVTLSISVAVQESVQVPLSSVQTSRGIDIIRNVEIHPNTINQVIPIEFMNNDVALEENSVFVIEITNKNTPSYVVGGDTTNGMLYDRISVTIADDDNVEVGFTESTISLNESMRRDISIMRRNSIASELRLTISGVQPPLMLMGESPVVIFTPDGPNTTTISVSTADDAVGGQGERSVILRLEYDGSPEFRQFVRIGGENTSEQIEIIIVDNDPSPDPPAPFPLEAIIGICAAGAGLAVLLLIIVILCLCICRLRVNRQGFYHTYEDKSEPPRMLRYSASLRSISSQTVIPVTEGRSVPKENEFYV